MLLKVIERRKLARNADGDYSMYALCPREKARAMAVDCQWA
jgi:hypothetical protein